MLRIFSGFVLLATLLLPPPISARDRLRAVSYSVRPGDGVTVRVFTSAGAQLAKVSGARIVDPDGRILPPPLGSVGVSGLSAPQIRQLLADEYALLNSDPVVEAVSKLKVNSTGAVGNPGHYLLDPSSTLVDALANAGDAGSDVEIGSYLAADPAVSRIVRNGELFVLDLTPNTADPSGFSLPVQSGDWTHIPVAERSRVREKVQFRSGMVSLALSAAALIILVGS